MRRITTAAVAGRYSLTLNTVIFMETNEQLKQLLKEHVKQQKTTGGISNLLQDIFKEAVHEMLKAEMDNHRIAVELKTPRDTSKYEVNIRDTGEKLHYHSENTKGG